METDRREQTPAVFRVRPPGVTPLEIWDLLIDGQVLWQSLRRPEFPSLLARAIHELHAGRAISRGDGPLTLARHAFDGVYVTGGGAAMVGLQNSLAALPWPTFVSSDGPFAARYGGFELLRRHRCGATGMVVDVGQSAIKVLTPEADSSFSRDWERLPIRDDDLPQDVGLARSLLREFLAACIHQVAKTMSAKPAGLVLALPCELSDDGVPGGSSYVGMQGDVDLPRDAVARAGLRDTRVLLLNDAELAALSAACDKRAALPARVLVVTLGFGVGGSLLVRET